MEGMRKWYMGVIVLAFILLAGVLVLLLGKMNDTTFGMWIGAMSIDAFGYGAANIAVKNITGVKGKKK